MKSYLNKLLFVVIICLCSASIAFAQDTLQQKLVKARSALSKVNAASKKLAPPKQIRQDLKTVNQQLGPVKTRLSQKKRAISSDTLNAYSDVLKRSQSKLSAYRKNLARSSGDLKSGHIALQKILKDSLLTVSKQDSASRPAMAAQLASLNDRLAAADRSVSTGLDTVTRLLNDVSAAYLGVTGLQTAVNERLKAEPPGKLQKETAYIWSAPKENNTGNIADNLGTTYTGQGQVFTHFLESTWGDRLLAFLLGALFFAWVFFNYRKAGRPEQQEKIGPLAFRHISPLPLTGASS